MRAKKWNLSERVNARTDYFCIFFCTKLKSAIEEQLGVHTHPLRGEQLYLIVLALEKFLNVLKNRRSSLQVTCGSLAHYTTQHNTTHQID